MKKSILILSLLGLISQTQIQAQDKKSEPEKKKQIRVKIIESGSEGTKTLDTVLEDDDQAKIIIKKFSGKSGSEEDVLKDIDVEDLLKRHPEGLSKRKIVRIQSPKMKIERCPNSSRRCEEGFDTFSFDMPDMQSLNADIQMEISNALKNIDAWSPESWAMQVKKPNEEDLKKAGIKKGTQEAVDELQIRQASRTKVQLYFEMEEPGSLQIQLLDSKGKEVFSQKYARYSGDYQNTVDLGRKLKGTYFLSIQTPQGISIRKLEPMNAEE